MSLPIPTSFPDTTDERLLRLLLCDKSELLQLWGEWKRVVPFDTIDYATMSLLPLLYMRLREEGIQDPLVSKIEGLYRLTWVKNQLLLKEVVPILAAFQKEGIGALLLKGAALFLAVYKNPGVRFVADVDVFVADANLQKAAAILRAHGWHSTHLPTNISETDTYLDAARDFSFTKGDACIDVHANLFYKDEYLTSWELLRTVRTRHPMTYAALFAEARTVTLQGMEVHVPSPEDLLIHVVAHGAGMNTLKPMRWVVDTAAIIENAEVNWQRVLERTVQFELVPEMQHAFSYLHETFPLKQIPDYFYQKLSALPVTQRRLQHYYALANGTRTTFGNLPLAWYRYRTLDANGRVSPSISSFTEFLCRNWRLRRRRDIPRFLLKRLYTRIFS